MNNSRSVLYRGVRVFACLGLAALLLWNTGSAAYAFSANGERVILSVWPKARYGGRDYYGAGARLTLYKVADAEVNDGDAAIQSFTLTDDFKKVKIDFSTIRQDGVDTAYTEMLENYIRKHKILGSTLVTDENGRGNFLDLTPGFYLVLQTGAEEHFYRRFQDIRPFAVCLPLQCLDEHGKPYLEYQVTVCPKLETRSLSDGNAWDDGSIRDGEGGGSGSVSIIDGGGGLPQTGLELISVYVLFAVGVLLLIAGARLIWSSGKREQEDEEDEA